MINTPAHKQTDPAKAPSQLVNYSGGDQTLADYIKRKEEAFKPLPEPLVMDGTLIRTAMQAIERSNPYVASLLREALDKASKV